MRSDSWILRSDKACYSNWILGSQWLTMQKVVQFSWFELPFPACLGLIDNRMTCFLVLFSLFNWYYRLEILSSKLLQDLLSSKKQSRLNYSNWLIRFLLCLFLTQSRRLSKWATQERNINSRFCSLDNNIQLTGTSTQLNLSWLILSSEWQQIDLRARDLFQFCWQRTRWRDSSYTHSHSLPHNRTSHWFNVLAWQSELVRQSELIWRNKSQCSDVGVCFSLCVRKMVSFELQCWRRWML